MEPIEQLASHGQSVWLDYIRRDLVRSGGLADLVRDGVRGVTSNPSIFEKGIGGSTEYDDALRDRLDGDAAASSLALFEAVAIVDIQEACDVLRSVYDDTDGADGFVSLEVSPHLAHDSEGTIREARRLWSEVGRPNLMIKVPATPEGIPAIEELLAEGINVNVTLMFSLEHYEDVAHAYLRGVRRAEHPERLASVASFFVSRVDTAVDAELDAIGTDRAKRLRGTIGIANSKLAYARYQELFEGSEFAELAERGVRPQRVLWASTSTKDPAYRDVLYVEELIGDNTVNTMPPETLEAFQDHGIARADAITEGVDAARDDIAALADLGIDFDAITDRLQHEGVHKFATSFDGMLSAIDGKRRTLLAESVDPQELRLGGLADAVEGRLGSWADDDVAERIWAKDHTVWVDELQPEIVDRLGWLTLPEAMQDHVEDIEWFVDQVLAEDLEEVVLLGMGGSSLAPEVFARTFGTAEGHLDLRVLDSTHPRAVSALAADIDPAHTLFVVASKSGTTVEPLSLFSFFWERVAEVTATPGRHFVAITDPGSPLVDLASDRGFRKTFTAIPDVGGRYSALTHFGLVPAALVGADVRRMLDRALRMAAASRRPAPDNPALRLGAAFGEAARAGRDKVTVVTSPSLAAFPDWFEQLAAESTGKDGTGIVPVAGEKLGAPAVYGDDRFFFVLSHADDGSDVEIAGLDTLEAAGHPIARIVVDDLADLAAEMYRAELAIAAAGAVLDIHPFDQPNVQLAKRLARYAMAGELDTGTIPATQVDDVDALRSELSDLLGSASSGTYVALQAFVAPTDGAEAALQRLRHRIRDAVAVTTTVGFGPRFLHSTGQLHKGGPDTGLFIQFVDHPEPDVEVPGEDFTFGTLVAGQADGDHQALVDAGRRVLRIDLGDDAVAGLEAVEAALDV